MANYASKLIAIASDEVGYLEKKSNKNLDDKVANAGSNNYTKYGVFTKTNGQFWCASFVSWCFNEAFGDAGKDMLCGGYSASSTAIRNQFSRRGQLHSNPQPGDVVFFNKNSDTKAEHVGIVYKVDKNRVYTIEGNTASGNDVVVDNGGAVSKKSYSLSFNQLYGFGRPNYDKEDDELTYENFKEYLDKYFAELKTEAPSVWSKDARAWAESNGIITGDSAGSKQYKAFCTREMMVQFLKRFKDSL